MTTDDPIERMMTGMADGDPAFLWAFVDEFGPIVRTVVRRMVESMGRVDIARDPGELDALMLDACDVIFDRASGWKTGGAKPWNWAYAAINARVGQAIGHRTVELKELGSDEDLDGEAGPYGGAVVTDLAGDDLSVLIARHDRVRLLDEAIRSVGTPEQQDIYWEYRLQQGFGDPSPANMVGRRFGRKPATVRQICKRHGEKVWRLVQADDRFIELHDHGWFQATGERSVA